MERQVRRWSVRKQKILFVFMTVIAAVYFFGLVYNGVKGKGMIVKVEKVETGEHVGSPKFDSTKLIR